MADFCIAIGAGVALLAAGHASALEAAVKEPAMAGSGETAFVAGLVLLLVVGRGLGEILQRFGQPAVMGQLIGGILLGPSLFGWVWPSAQHFIFPAIRRRKA